MKGYNLLSLFILLLLLPLSSAQYWFQSGVRAGTGSYFNHGAKISIQTVSNQNVNHGSMAFWTGETLADDSFLQVGYLIPNESGYYPTNCTVNGCASRTYLSKGAPEWFYEYFSGTGTHTFTGNIGPNDSAGPNGSIHTYGFFSSGDKWSFFMDGKILGAVFLGTNNSGSNSAVGFAEVANTSSTTPIMLPVMFSNLSIYNGSRFMKATHGYSYIGYGVGSASGIPNPYGVKEVDSRINYFKVGSGLPTLNEIQLWQLGYYLTITSQYGNLSGTYGFVAYRNVPLPELGNRLQESESYPELSTVMLPHSRAGNGTRAVFLSWQGSGPGSYSGSSDDANVTMFQNITEHADWGIQYLLNVSSGIGSTSGSGWYNANSTATYSINESDIYAGNMSRWNFSGWSSGATGMSNNVLMTMPYSVSALWNKQYLVNGHTAHGEIKGLGWYTQDSAANVSIIGRYVNETSRRRRAFFSWSNGNMNDNITLNVNSPISINATFRNQSLETLESTDAYGQRISGVSLYSGVDLINSHSFLFDNYRYNISSAYYKGVAMPLSKTVNVSSPGIVQVVLPVYNIEIYTTDVFGSPVNATVDVQFMNGSSESLYSGTSGHIEIPDVPYGKSTVTALLSGQVVHSLSYGDAVIKITFISNSDLAALAMMVIIGMIAYALAGRRLSRHGDPRATHARTA
ncbi:MAG: hypothetical protein M1569_02010 [Candidatus Marsarchaeota archaeon]|nr:hypothetical protein [Candidatus Marsarchaeota archaeon]MCL5413155.1 hypothetical protein [Candidatus Marsarchaeota archaeon]